MRRNLSFKTKMLNSVRSLFKLKFIERILAARVRSSPASIYYKLLPNHYQYESPTIRLCKRSGINYSLDISDLVDWHVYFGLPEFSHDYFLSRCGKFDILIDIGANIGSFMMKMAKTVPNGGVLAFEPDPINHQKLLNNMSLNDLDNVEVLQFGLGSARRTEVLQQLEVGNFGKNNILLDNESSTNGNTIEIYTLDEVVELKGVKRIDAIKIDVEGYEFDVLKGAKNVLRQHKPRIMLELDDNYLQRYGASASLLLAELESYGYSIYDINAQRRIGSNENFENVHTDIYAVQTSLQELF